MIDTRLARLAKVLVRYSIGAKKGDWMRIEGPALARDLMLAAYIEALKAGAHPMFRVSLPDAEWAFFRHAGREQLRFVPPSTRLENDRLDAVLTIWGSWNTKAMTSVDPKRMALHRAARRPLFEQFHERVARGSLHWCGTQFPCEASAQDAEMSLTEYEDFVLSAGMVDRKDPVGEWRKVSARQKKMARFLGTLSSIRIVGLDTDLSFRVKGRRWINCDGHQNFPDGEIFTGPIEDSAEGHIRYAFPANYQGREVENVRLTFKQGKVVEARADKGEEFLNATLDTDPGARYVGELSFGTNYAIERFTRNTLFDEKIGGTMHIAVGASLPESGGRNKSAIHWDMICDTRKGFTVYGNGRPIMKEGRLLLP